MGEKDEARGRSTDEKIGCINKEQQNLSFMIVILAKEGNQRSLLSWIPAGVYPVHLKRGTNDVQESGVEFP